MALLSPHLSSFPSPFYPQGPFLYSRCSLWHGHRRCRRHLGPGGASPVVRASWEELAGVLIFSIILFMAVKAFPNSSLGERLHRRLEETNKVTEERSSRFKALARKARKGSLWYGRDRPKWLGPIPYEYPSYLDGEYPGDYGFDVTGLGKDPVAFQKYFNFEILHARWAMLKSLGVLVPELLDLLGIVHFVELVWWRVRYAKLQGDTLDYLGILGFHIAGSQGVLVIAIYQALLMVGLEYARYCGIEALEPLGIHLVSIFLETSTILAGHTLTHWTFPKTRAQGKRDKKMAIGYDCLVRLLFSSSSHK